MITFYWLGGYEDWCKRRVSPIANVYKGLFYIEQDELRAATMLEF